MPKRLWIEALSAAEVCGKCGAPIAAGAPVWLGEGAYNPAPFVIRRYVTVLCHECAGKPHIGDRTGNCEGCGRQVTRRRKRYARRWYCSERCESRVGARKAKQKRVAARAGKTCVVCGESFDPGKSNAVTCSAACRQKAYRRRVRESADAMRAALGL